MKVIMADPIHFSSICATVEKQFVANSAEYWYYTPGVAMKLSAAVHLLLVCPSNKHPASDGCKVSLLLPGTIPDPTILHVVS